MDRNEVQRFSDIIVNRIVGYIKICKLSAEFKNNNIEDAKKCKEVLQCIEKQLPICVEQFWNEEKELSSIIKLNDRFKALTSMLPEKIRKEVNNYIDDSIEKFFAE